MPSSLQEQTNKLGLLERLRYHCHSELLTWISLMTPIWLTELQHAKVQQCFLLCLYSKNTGKKAIACGHCCSKEDTLMPIRMMHSWEVLWHGMDPPSAEGLAMHPMLVVLQESCQGLCGLQVMPVGQNAGCVGPEEAWSPQQLKTKKVSQLAHFRDRCHLMQPAFSHEECILFWDSQSAPIIKNEHSNHGKLYWLWGRIHTA